MKLPYDVFEEMKLIFIETDILISHVDVVNMRSNRELLHIAFIGTQFYLCCTDHCSGKFI